MLRHMRLDEHDAALRIEPRCQPIEQSVNRILLHLRGVRVVRRECVPISDAEKALVLVLHLHPVRQRTDIMADVKLASRAHAAQHPFFSLFPHTPSIRMKTFLVGTNSTLSTLPPQMNRSNNPNIPSMS